MLVLNVKGAARDGEYAAQLGGRVVAHQSRAEEDGDAAVLRRNVPGAKDEGERGAHHTL